MEWMLSVVDNQDNEHERSGEADSLRKAERDILQAIKEIEEDIASYAEEDL